MTLSPTHEMGFGQCSDLYWKMITNEVQSTDRLIAEHRPFSFFMVMMWMLLVTHNFQK